MVPACIHDIRQKIVFENRDIKGSVTFGKGFGHWEDIFYLETLDPFVWSYFMLHLRVRKESF